MTQHAQDAGAHMMVYIPELSISRGTTDGVTQQNVSDRTRKGAREREVIGIKVSSNSLCCAMVVPTTQ